MNTVIVPNAVHTIEIGTKYSSEERLKQTIEFTIPCIKNKLGPNTFIIIVEDSNVTEEEELILKANCNVYINVHAITNNLPKCKGTRETLAIIEALNHIPPETEWLFKLGGRYSWNEDFDLNNFPVGKMTFKYFNFPQNEFETATFAIYKDCIALFKVIYYSILQKILYYNGTLNGTLREYLNLIPEKVNSVETFGLTVRNTWGWYNGISTL
jgi:hypothetical protein